LRSAFVHLIDVLSHCSVGRTNMDLSKNMTIDLLNVDRSNLLSLSDPASTIVIVSITKGNLVSVLDYDADLSIYDRSEHVTALIQTPGITGMLALDEGQPCGYALLCKNRVLLLYANNEEIFK
ncbi:hypothetical protein Angca_000189, partial [Angiostrongylus cantonensis]